MERLYIIISLKHTRDKWCFWQTDDAGYTTNPFQAGRYPESIVKKRPDYYNNGVTTLCIPVDLMPSVLPVEVTTERISKERLLAIAIAVNAPTH